MKHEIKMEPHIYKRVADGSRTFDVADVDCDYQVGDTVVIREWDPEPINPTATAPKGFTDSPALEFRVGYIHILGSSRAVFSLLPLKKAKA